jgi:hypothetical protein
VTTTTTNLNATLAAAREAAEAGNLTELKIAFGLLDLELSNGAPLPEAWRRPLVPAFGVNPLIDKMLWDTFVTALEGGIGYWAASSSYHIWADDNGTEDHEGFYSDVVDADYPPGDPDAEFPPTRVDRAVIARGFERVATGEHNMHSDAAGKFAWMLQARLAGKDDYEVDVDFDAGDADCLVQIAMFGKLVFG